MNDVTKQLIADYVVGTCMSVAEISSKFDLSPEDEEDLESTLEDMNVERCPFCEWWCESWELVDEDGEVVGCDDCRR